MEPPVNDFLKVDAVVKSGEDTRVGAMCVLVCVYLSSGFKGQCFNYAIPIATSFPPMTSLPYLGLVVFPLRTPGGIW